MIESFFVRILGVHLSQAIGMCLMISFIIIAIPCFIFNLTRTFDHLYNWGSEKKDLERKIESLEYDIKIHKRY